jgi:hypothetical protein
MRIDRLELDRAARRARAEGIAAALAAAFAWVVTRFARPAKPGYKAHAARPHFAR